MIALKDNSTYIEKITLQNSADTDWVSVDNTTVGYTPKELGVLSTSTTSSLKVTTALVDRVPAASDKLLAIDANNTITEIVAGTVTDDGPTIKQLNSFQSTGVTSGDAFGVSMSISSDGLICIVGAVGISSRAGKAYTFTRATISDTWTEQNSFVANGLGSGDEFGIGVSLSPDGLICMVGARGASSNTGKVYTFTRATTSDAWTEQNSFISSSTVSGDYFGCSVSISSDGLICIVGAYRVSSYTGRAYTFTRATTSDTWTEQNSFVSSSSVNGDNFGTGVTLSVDGLMCVVGAMGVSSVTGKAYTFTRATTSDAWTEQNSFAASGLGSNDNFGASVGMSGNGLVCIVGAYEISSRQGAAYIFKRATTSDTWTQVHEITDPGATGNDLFGFGCSIIQDGTIALVGTWANNNSTTTANKVYTFDVNESYSIDTSGANLTTVPTKVFYNDNVDVSVCLEATKDRISSLERTLTKVSSTTTQFVGNLPGTQNVALATGDTVVIDGANVALTSTTTTGIGVLDLTNPILVNSFQSTGVTGTDGFGASTSISSDGLICIVGAPGVSSYTGKAYTFTRATTSDTWTEQNSFAASGLGSKDRFGQGISLSSNGLICIVGATGISSGTGRAYTFIRATTSDAWTEQNSFVSSSTVSGDGFGSDISLSSDCMVSAYNVSSGTGRAYTFTRATTSLYIYKSYYF